MEIRNALAGIAVANLDDAVAWYTGLIGRAPDSHPMSEVYEYRMAKGGWIQIFADAERCGKSSLTLTVDSVDDVIAALESRGIEAGEPTRSDYVDTTTVFDPDGNRIVFAEAKSENNRAAS